MANKRINSDFQTKRNLTTIIKGARIDLIGRIFNAGIRYVYVLLLARFLGADQLGIFFLGIVVIEFFAVFSRLGLDTGVLKYTPISFGQKNKAKIKGVINHSLLFVVINSVLFGIILIILAEFLANNIFHKSDLKNVLLLLSVSLPFSAMMLILLSATQGFHTMRYRVYAENITNPLLNIFLILLFFLFGWKLKGVTSAYVISFVVCAFLSFIFLKRLFPEISDNKIKLIYETRKLFKFSTPLLFVNFLNLIMMWTDILMLGYFKTAADVGIYNIAVKTAFFISFVIMSFTSIFAPRISELYANKKIDELEILYKTVTRWIFLFSIPIFLIIVLLSKNILFIFGDQFVAGYISLTILAFAHLINASVGSVKYILMISENEKLVMYNTVGISILNILLNIILIPKYAINGAAMATAASIILINLIMLLQVYKLLGIHPYNLKYLKPLISGMIVAAIGLIFKNQLQISNPILVLFIGALLFSAVYFVIVRLLGFDEQDRLVLQTLKLRINKD